MITNGKSQMANRKWQIAYGLIFLVTVFLASGGGGGLPVFADELEVKEDMTVDGTGGTKNNPNVWVKGYSAFATTTTNAGSVTNGAGSVYIQGNLEVDGASYLDGQVIFGDPATTEAVFVHNRRADGSISGNLTVTGTVTGGTLTDGTFSVTGGAITGATGNISMWTNDSSYITSESDGVVGNEVTDAANTTLTRSGAGTGGDPYKLALNLGNANTWTAGQTFDSLTANTITLSGETLGNISVGTTETVFIHNQRSDASSYFSGGLDMQNNLITNIGHANTDFTSGGGLNIQGNVGIGTTSPSAKLSAVSSQPSAVVGHFKAAPSQTANIFEIRDSADSGLLIADSSGNVGIGTTEPGARLHVYSGAAKQAIFSGWSDTKGAETANAGQISIGGNLNYQGNIQYLSAGNGGYLYIDNTYNADNGNIYFRTKTAGTPVNAMTILGSGKVGIGTTSPGAYKLNVTGGNLYVGGNITATGTISGAFSGSGIISGLTPGKIPKAATSSTLADSVIYESSGNVGIGTTGPTTKLQLPVPIYYSANSPLAGITFKEAGSTGKAYITPFIGATAVSYTHLTLPTKRIV